MSDTDVTTDVKPGNIIAPTADRAEGALQTLNMGAALLDQMFDRARRFPRDLELVQARSLHELIIVPDLAARSYYSIPYNQGQKNETRVEGPSIKAAMTLCRNWGNCFNEGRFADEDKSNVICQGIFLDFETCVPTIRALRVSKFYKPRGAQGVVPRNADALYNAVQAGISKAVRNSILATLPDFLVHAYFQKAKDLVVNPPTKAGTTVLSLQDRILKAKQTICKVFSVTPQEMEAYLIDNGDQIEDDGALLVHLQGLYNSLKDGAYQADAVFRPGKADKPMPGMPEEK